MSLNSSTEEYQVQEISDSDSHGCTPEPLEKTSTRVISKPARFRNTNLVPSIPVETEQLALTLKDKCIAVKCNQTGKSLKVKVNALSREDERPLSNADLAIGQQLLLDTDNKTYPVTVRKVLTEIKEPSKKKGACKRPASDDQPHKNPKKQKVAIDTENLLAAKAAFDKEVQPEISSPTKFTSADRQLLLEIKEELGTLCSLLNSGGESAVIKKEVTDDCYMVNGINLLRIPSRDGYAYARTMLDILFSKIEQKNSVVLQTKKSDKPPLSPKRVELLFDCVDKRYKEMNHKQLMTTLNQKCRDAKPDVKDL